MTGSPLSFHGLIRTPITAAIFSLFALSGCGGGGSDTATTAPEVKKDTTAPVITITGANPLKHAYGSDYVELGATALDAVDGVVEVSVEGGVNIDMMNDYIITYTATDKAGNKATEKRTVSVEDLTAPVITLNGDNEVGLVQFDTYQELGAIAQDDVDGALTVEAPSGEIDSTKLGSYPLTYSIADNAGNTATTVRTVVVREQKPFITTWDTTKFGVSGNDQIKITTNSIENGGEFEYNYTVDWGDGTTSENLTGDYTHTYDNAVPGYQTGSGVYTVQISGIFPQIYSYALSGMDMEKIVSIEQWGDIKWLSFNGAFADAINMVSNAQDTPDLRFVTDMYEAFAGAELFNGNVQNWDVSKVTDMAGMFINNKNFNQNIGNWNVSAVTNMDGMFFGASIFNQNIGNWDVSQVEETYSMFEGALAFDQNLSSWDVSSATRMEKMFSNSGLSQTNYDAILTSWSQLTLKQGVEFGAGTIHYSSSSQDARNVLTSAPNFWLITDGGVAP
ncbi:hypothetical protein CW745_01095 [Psychromonas sp. psych-6C06]|uniref:BspA family leucine-rich repeat surface protein n=1 Tax=Psychromonas sp. psych-6C06 TaxID=2058089 RepID=UPI000C33E82F|nr:BspA family leucine-rich repeat surface protein [Psychromonas sp. psych-6C06]PKF63475.1 hypothetical protein CW745_01095 [Psychromonas sp. psych-6C06]